MSKIKQAVTALANGVKTAVTRNFHSSSFKAQGHSGSIDLSTDLRAAEAYEQFLQAHKPAASKSITFSTPYADTPPVITVGAQNKPEEGKKVQAILDARREQLAAPKSEGEKVNAIMQQRREQLSAAATSQTR